MLISNIINIMADKNTEHENGDDLGYGSQRKDIMDEGLTPMRTTRKGANEKNGHENRTRNGKPNINDYMDETEIIILKKKRSNTERTMTPGG
jgi:hypothetical protein